MNQAFAAVQPSLPSPVLDAMHPVTTEPLDIQNGILSEQSTSGSDSDSGPDQTEAGSQARRMLERRRGYIRRVTSVVKRENSVNGVPTKPLRKTSTHGHLFECVLLTGLSYDADKGCYIPFIKRKFPPEASVPPHIEHFCFPDATEWPLTEGCCGQTYSLVITDAYGVRRFGYCRRVLPEGAAAPIPLAYCIISPVRAYGFYLKILAELECRHGYAESLQTEFLQNLYDRPFPGPGQTVTLSPPVGSPSEKVSVLKRPADLRLEERDLTELFTCLPVSTFLHLFGSILLERKVLLVSASLSKLSSCIEALQSILYPFSWQHTFIPVLPTHLLDICNAPTPYIMGILRQKNGSVPSVTPEEGMLVDLDEACILHCVGDEGSILPSRLTRALKVALQLVTGTTQPQDASRNVLISETFIRLFVEVCGHYQNHIVTQQDGQRVFERESFIKAVESQSIQMFLEWFSETAMFTAFIDSRVDKGLDFKGIFEQRALDVSDEMEKNALLFLKNMKVINKKNKKLGALLKDWTPFT